MKPLVSVIIPIYNLELYLHKSINSVLHQMNPNFELILINDGSTDTSGSLCDEYAEKDKRIRVKQMKNNGVSSARNAGIEMARGEWLLFLDGDDVLELDTIQYILQAAEQNEIDMLAGGFKYVYSSKVVCADNSACIDKGVNLIHDYGSWNLKICIGSFAIKKEIVDRYNIFFHTGTKYGEDVEFITNCLLNSRMAMVTPKYFSNYVVHNDSAIAKVNFRRYDCYEARKRTLQAILDKFPEHTDIECLYKDYLLPEAIIETTHLLCRSGVSVFNIKKFLKENKYDYVIHSVKDNQNTPLHIKRKINKFINNPMITWLEWYWMSRYYQAREYLGLIKRRVL